MSDNVLELRPGARVLTVEKREDGMTHITLANTWDRSTSVCYITEEEASQLADHLRSEYVETWRDARVIRVTPDAGEPRTFFRFNGGGYAHENGIFYSESDILALGGNVEVALQ